MPISTVSRRIAEIEAQLGVRPPHRTLLISHYGSHPSHFSTSFACKNLEYRRVEGAHQPYQASDNWPRPNNFCGPNYGPVTEPGVTGPRRALMGAVIGMGDRGVALLQQALAR